ncbi:hypothetical protein GPA22_05710 [Aromatoleum toluvorans]|uniref:Uncharacterized protein n=1 Tax=Aromatoleum toluvorans TaxID=92002 RepID=A0ABX1PX46_9RHOO|nr:hypothetical protein [Aromatoleum toluvorans]NMG43227.1 hypothetical protein [Aromatoleum toluvorans]
MLAYVPKFHERVDRALSRALNGVTVLSDIRAAVVTTLPGAITPVAQDIAAIREDVEAMPAHIDRSQADVLTELKAGLAATAAQIVRDLKSAPTLPPAPDLDARLAPVLRILIQAQALALDATPDETVGKPKQFKDDVAIEALRTSDTADTARKILPPTLAQRFDRALRKFDDPTPAHRGRRWGEMQQLCAEIAALHLQDDHGKA